MFYKNSTRKICIGDRLISDGAYGVVVCDYEDGLTLPGYEGLLTRERLADGSTFDGGVMIYSEKYGLLYYAEVDDDICPCD